MRNRLWQQGIRRRPRRRARRAVLVLATVSMIGAAAGCSSAASPVPLASPGTTASFPHTAAGSQARWLFAAVKHQPIPAAEVTAHFDRGFLAQVPSAQLNASFAGLSSLRLDSVTTSTPDNLVFIVTANGSTRLRVSLATDGHGLIGGLLLRPAGAPPAALPPVPSTWGGVDRQIRSVAPEVRLLVASVSGHACQPIQAIGATAPAPLGSAFKLYVLDALARAVASGKVSWHQQLTVTSQLKSLPSGELQNDPDGTRLSVQRTAAMMISISDNTAANMLMALLGRPAVEAATRSSGMADPGRDAPFLTTRELFVLKLDDWPKLASRYLALGTAGRLALLAGTIGHIPLSALNPSGWTSPRDINSLEWFASPTDICRVYASLAAAARQPKLAPVASILELNSGGLSLDRSQWRSVWFKGGSEPGVLTLNYLATTRAGKSYVVSVLAENPSAPIAEAAAAQKLISAIKGAFQLAAR
jgi:Beta-lactamase enzyme family/ORF 12 gene product N-terminal